MRKLARALIIFALTITALARVINYSSNSPTTLQAKRVSSNQIDLLWDDNFSNERRFVIFRKATGEQKFKKVSAVPPNITSYRDSNLEAGLTYFYKVKVIMEETKSRFSNVAISTTAIKIPERPRKLEAMEILPHKILLSWRDKSKNELGFQIKRKILWGKFQGVGNVDADLNSYKDTKLRANTTYIYRITAYNEIGVSEYSKELAVKTKRTENIPNGLKKLKAEPLSESEIKLTWRDKSENEQGFKIIRSRDGIEYSKIDKVEKDVTTYKDSGLEPGTTYYYRVVAYNKAGHSDFSNEASATTNPGITMPPTITPPAGFTLEDIIITEATTPAPKKINYHFVPTGKIYEIEIKDKSSQIKKRADFGENFAELHFKYNKTGLLNAGLIEEFVVFYYDLDDDTWKPVDRTELDANNSEVIAYTSHFTPFVLTATPPAAGEVPEPPPCIENDFPGGIGGSGGAVFTIVDENFKYYQDRDYFFKPLSQSSTNTTTFAALGFDQALGIATKNNDKSFADVDYIFFTAHTDIDVYVLYDTRGGTGPGDTSGDAPWLSDFTNTGYFIQTTDSSMDLYTVYRKSYNEGEEVHLHGNIYGGADPAIQSNYFVIVKPQGSTEGDSAYDLCVDSPSEPPSRVTNLQAIPGMDALGNPIVTLTWQNPDDPDFAGIVIMKSEDAPPMKIGETQPPSGTVLSPQSYLDDGVNVGTTYFYTVFAVDQDDNSSIGESVAVTTGADTDLDGLTDDYENIIGTNPNDPDSDDDGINDGDEVAQGTDPLGSDLEAPSITNFNRTSSSPTSDPAVTFTLDGTDNNAITHWMITITDTKPLSNNTNWQALKPTGYTLDIDYGICNLYAWAKDTSGNVSDSAFITVDYVDSTPPVITLLGTDPVSVEVGSSYTDAGATASDNYDGDLTAGIVTVNPVDINTVGSYTVTYNVSDAAGNPAVEVTRTVNVVDTTAPVITLLGTDPVSVEVKSSYTDAGAAASDNYDGDITAGIVTVNPVDINTKGSYTVTYNVSDAASNPAVEVTRTVNVVDTTAPVITLLGTDPVSVEVKSSYADAGAAASDNYDGDLTAGIVTVNPVDINAVGSYTVTYNVVDAAGNPAVEVTRTVNVVDTTAPVITLLGTDPVSVEVKSSYADAGAAASDNYDGDLTAGIVTVNPVDINTVGSYTVTYNVSDAAGNPAVEVTRTVNVVDTTPPVITDFTLTSDYSTTIPNITFTLEGNDNVGITGWMITETSAKPGAGNPEWMGTKPNSYTLTSGYGFITVYAWSKDAVGNVTHAPTASINVKYAAKDVLLGNYTIVDEDDISALSNYTQITGDLKIESTSLINLAGLENLKQIGGDLVIEGNSDLVFLQGLGGLTSVGGLHIFDTDLANLDGLNELTSINGSVDIMGNNHLIDLTGLGNLRTIYGDLNITGNNNLNNLNGLGLLESVHGKLRIESTALMNLVGLNRLNSINGSVNIMGNNHLIDLTGLDNLKTIYGHLNITGNNSLINLKGLNMLTIVGELIVRNNNSLNSLEGLGNITTANGDVLIGFNPRLQSLHGLELLESVHGSLRIESNDELSSLHGLDLISSIEGDLSIDNNHSLHVFGGLGILTTLHGYLKITNNILLPTSEAYELRDRLIASGFTGPVEISGNQ